MKKVKYLHIFLALFLGFIAGSNLLILNECAYSQDIENEMPSTNYDEFITSAENSLLKLEDNIAVLGRDRIYFLKINAGKDETGFLLPLMKARFSAYRMLYSQDADTMDYKISVDNVSLKTLYPEITTERVLGDKIVKRKVTVSYKLTISDKYGKQIKNETVFEKSESTFPLDYYEYIEMGRYAFMKGELPKESLFKKLLIPGIIVISSAAAVVLFFTVRSK